MNEEVRKQKAKTRFNSVRQFNTESIGEFYNRYERECDLYEDAGNQHVELTIIGPDDNEEVAAVKEQHTTKIQRMLAVDFLMKLDQNRFRGMMVSFQNADTEGRDIWPLTVNEAYNRALTYRNQDGTLAHTMMGRRVTDGAVFAAAKTEPVPTTSEKVKPMEYRADKKTGVKRNECAYCKKEGHWKRDCPLLVEGAKKLQQGSGKALTSIQNESETTYKICATAKNYGLDDFDILLDNQATVSVFSNKAILKNVKEQSQEKE
jgi:hypothetical protein